jgi:hypothetical protein
MVTSFLPVDSFGATRINTQEGKVHHPLNLFLGGPPLPYLSLFLFRASPSFAAAFFFFFPSSFSISISSRSVVLALV